MDQTMLGGEFTSQLVDVYREKSPVPGFGRAFFKTRTAATKYISVQVERGTEKIALDVPRGTDGNRNTFGKKTEKQFLPPYFYEYFDITELDLYERVLGATADSNVNIALFDQFVRDTAENLLELTNKIERAKERQCWQLLETGIVTLVSGDNIDMKRLAASLVNLSGAGGYWSTGSTDVFAQFQAGCTFVRQKGKYSGSEFNAILGDTAIAALFSNDTFKERQNLYNLVLDQVVVPNKAATGGVYHGTITAGPYRVNLWSYPEYYDDPTTGVSTAYFNPKKVVILPAKPNFIYSHAAVPQLMRGVPGSMPAQGEYVIGDYIDERETAHIYTVKSAGVPIMTAVDQAYTMQVVA